MIERARILILAIPIVVAGVPAAFGQAGLLRSQTEAITGAIENQIREAVRPRLMVKNAAGPVTRLALSAKGRLLAIVYHGSDLRLWDLEAGAEQAHVRMADPVRSLQVGADGRTVALGTEGGNVLVLNAANATSVLRLHAHRGAVAAIAISRDGSRIVSAGAGGTIRLWDGERGRLVSSLAGRPGITALALSPGGSRVVAGYAKGGAILWRPRAGPAPLPLAGASGGVLAVGFGARGRIAAVLGDGSVHFWSAEGAPLSQVRAANGAQRAEFSEDGRVVAIGQSNRQIAVFDLGSGRVLRELKALPGGSRFVEVDLDHKRVLTAGRDGVVNIFDLDTGRSLAEIISTIGGWAALDGQGRFDGTPSGVADVEWLAAKQMLPVDNFSATYFEPGLIADYMRSRPNFAAPAPAAVAAGITLPPRVTISAPPGPYAAGAEVAVTVTAIDEGGGIATIRLFQNGKLVPAGRESGERKGRSNVIRTYRVQLVAGRNAFSAYAANRQRIDGETAHAELTAAGPRPLPNLDIVAIGINRYRDSRFDLDYAVNDAVAILRRLDHESSGLFKRVVAYQLTDRAATRAKIIAVLTALRGLPARDVLVVYLAGHGAVIGNEWYLLPQDVAFTREGVERDGISATELRNMLAEAGPQRILLMVDSCKSGSILDPLASSMDRRVLRSVGRDTGVAILAGARANEEAAEIPRLGHGAFTYVVLEGLAGKAERSHAGHVTADGLLSYSTEALPSLTKSIANYMQVPVAWSRGQNFAVAR